MARQGTEPWNFAEFLTRPGVDDLVRAGLDPAWARAAHVDIVKTIMNEGKYAGKKVWAAGGAAARWVKENLQSPLGDPLMHAQAAMDMQAQLASRILEDLTDDTTSWSIPGPALRASSDRGASQLMLAVAGDDQKIRKVSTQLRKQHVPSRLRERRATPQARAPRRLPSTTTST
jgi:hypothetical protein